MKQKRRRGRPTRAEASAAVLASLGIDPSTIEPWAIVAAIASDASVPARERLLACRMLLDRSSVGGDGKSDSKAADRLEELSRRTIEIMRRGAN
jgi:hypothetical protein